MCHTCSAYICLLCKALFRIKINGSVKFLIAIFNQFFGLSTRHTVHNSLKFILIVRKQTKPDKTPLPFVIAQSSRIDRSQNSEQLI